MSLNFRKYQMLARLYESLSRYDYNVANGEDLAENDRDAIYELFKDGLAAGEIVLNGHALWFVIERIKAGETQWVI